jgi:hypothetical protein
MELEINKNDEESKLVPDDQPDNMILICNKRRVFPKCQNIGGLLVSFFMITIPSIFFFSNV